MCRVIVLQGSKLRGDLQKRLEDAIVAGPPSEKYRKDIEPDIFQHLVARSIWLRLAKLDASGISIGGAAAVKLKEISDIYSDFQLSDSERDEFSSWMSGTGDPDFEDNREIDIAPKKRSELFHWLQKPSSNSPFSEDTWRYVCQKHLLNSLYALGDLAEENIWPINRWREAFQSWSEERLALKSWQYATPFIKNIPDEILKEIAHSVTYWLRKVSESIKKDEDILFKLCKRITILFSGKNGNINETSRESSQSINEAINHPIGHVTEAVINLWTKEKPKDNDLLPPQTRSFFTQISNIKEKEFRHGRVLLGSRLIALFRVDREWSKECLLPFFDWENSKEAKAMWEGFLWSPRLYQPLLLSLKSQFLATAKHHAELGGNLQRYAAFLTYAALGPIEGYTSQEFRTAIEDLPQEGLEACAQALSQALESAGDQRENYWKNRVQPFWQHIWPKSRDFATQRISASLIRAAIAARAEFPAALAMIKNWIQPLEHPHTVIHLLHTSELDSRFPAEALTLMDAIITEQPWVHRELGHCLNNIIQSSPELERTPQYQRLRELFRKHRGDQ
ncbi:hypothetical protein GCM10010082_25570 [Kushneria pakistanensis]|uniref:Uncharacterized protein n=2 Tax=Kushneria pakistanensis TaxID=1508770 RepID=A0ABQ3FMX9_9GAMM|nr:hypothetical protein GCM10010082_25570 [Kushneria pakistanensis]